ncbi:hypothetical protein TNCT_116541, partial [Trichonephila clavata]
KKNIAYGGIGEFRQI